MALGRMVIVALVAVVAVGLSGVTYAVAVAPQTNAQPQAGSDAPTYGVTFQETGLAAGTNWGVTVFGPWGSGEDGSHFQSSANSSMAFSLPNGTYRYDVRNVLGYDIAANGSRGTFNVSGGMATSIDVSFVPLPTYDVTFTEAGLAPGTTWTVTVFPSGEAEGDGMGVLSTATLSSNTTTLTFALPNGTYSYYVHAVSGYQMDN